MTGQQNSASLLGWNDACEAALLVLAPLAARSSFSGMSDLRDMMWPSSEGRVLCSSALTCGHEPN